MDTQGRKIWPQDSYIWEKKMENYLLAENILLKLAGSKYISFLFFFYFLYSDNY